MAHTYTKARFLLREYFLLKYLFFFIGKHEFYFKRSPDNKEIKSEDMSIDFMIW